jgi:hypothetical protein
MAALRSVYTDTSEIDRTRAEYADGIAMPRRLRHSGAVPVAAAIAAVGLIGPFQVAYQGSNARVLQAVHSRLVAEIMARAYPAWTECPLRPWRPGQHIRVGVVSGGLLAAQRVANSCARLGQEP